MLYTGKAIFSLGGVYPTNMDCDELIDKIYHTLIDPEPEDFATTAKCINVDDLPSRSMRYYG